MISIFELPQNWGWVRLESLCELFGGGTPSRSNVAYFGDGIIWITPSDLDMNSPVQVVVDSKTRLTQVGLDSSSARLLPTGTVLFSSRATIGKIAIAGIPLATNQGFANFVCGQRIDNRYLAWVLRNFTESIKSLASSTTYLEISRGALRAFEIPLPYPDDPTRSLAEQRRIVARIEALFAELRECRQLHREIVKDTGRLMDAVLQQIFDQPNQDWIEEPLNTVAHIQSGTAKGRQFGTRKTIETPYLRVANVQAGYLDLSEIKTITIAESELEQYRLHQGDLLLTEGGDYDKLGRGAIWEGQIDNCIHQNHIFAVRFEPSKIIPKFAEFEMQSWHARNYFMSVAKKTTNLATINKTKLGDFPMRYPSPTEQQRIVSFLDAIKVEISEMRQTEQTDSGLLTQMEQAVLAQAFRGEL